MANTRQLCSFFVGDLFLGISVQHVQEVLRYQAMTRIPLAPRTVAGLINLRGQIVTAIDLRCRLGLPAFDADHRPMNVVVRDRDNPVSLLVDRIGDVLEVSDDLCEAPPSTMPVAAAGLIVETYKLADRLLLVADVERLLADIQPLVQCERKLAS